MDTEVLDALSLNNYKIKPCEEMDTEVLDALSHIKYLKDENVETDTIMEWTDRHYVHLYSLIIIY